MKRLIIASAIVCAAVLTQAATFTWTMSNVYAEGTTTGVSGIAYLFAGDTYTTESIIAALEGKGVANVNEWLGGVTKYTTSVSSGTLRDTSTKPNATTAGLVADGTTQTLYALIFNTAEVSADSKFYVASADRTVPSSEQNALFAFGNHDTDSAAKGAWHAVNVPEPTSGLLLLIGAAGLALRRKRA